MTRFGNAVFLGAGFSKWSCDLPLVSQLFDFKVRSDSQREARRFERLRKRYEAWRDATRSENAERFIEAMQALPADSKLTNWYITRRLTEPFVKRYSRRFTWYINSYHAGEHPGIQSVREFLRYSSSIIPSTIITTNYDMIVEYALSSKGFNYGVEGESIGFSPYPYPRPVHVTGRLPLLKLHGSVSWAHGSKFPDSRCGLNGECTIVPPRAYKRPREYFPEVWDFAEEALSKTKTTTFFGFAFNEYDEDVWSLLERNLAGSERMLLIDVVDHRPRISAKFPNVDIQFMDVNADFKIDSVFKFVF